MVNVARVIGVYRDVVGSRLHGVSAGRITGVIPGLAVKQDRYRDEVGSGHQLDLDP